MRMRSVMCRAQSYVFYYYWSPDGTRLAFLCNGRHMQHYSIILHVIDLYQPHLPPIPLMAGAPLYFSWSVLANLCPFFITLLVHAWLRAASVGHCPQYVVASIE